VAILREMAETAASAVREPAGLEHLVVGMQCGGSDGYSGITANPALGAASDLLVGPWRHHDPERDARDLRAEHLLPAAPSAARSARRSSSASSGGRTTPPATGGEMDNNPSPGNKKGGLTTILEKSLGAVAKGGTAPLTQVYKFAEPVTERGFVYMDSPGYDPCSVTGQVASGANLVAFTTGRGSVSGYKPVPCVKLATNSEMFARMSEDMDIDCGDVVTRGVGLEEKGREILEVFLDVASGRPTKSEALGFGGAEFVPWAMGAVM
jgi:altronate hydrolase/galactarate dehydratase